MRKTYAKHLLRDSIIIIIGIIASFFLVRYGLIQKFVGFTSGAQEVASFIAGMFFTSVLTIAPASVALISLSQNIAPIEIAFWGGLGATMVDLALFSFMRNDLSKDVQGILKPSLRRHIMSLFHFGFMKWIVTGAGALIIASPFPDEIGLALLSMARVKPRQLLAITFVMNTLGILALTSAAQALL